MQSNALRRDANSRGNARFAVTTVLVLGLVLAGIWFGFLRPESGVEADVPLTPPLERGPLRVTVMESGNLDSLDAHKVVNRVEGRTAIDYVIPEGTILTPEDVAKGTVLVRLNTADLDEKLVRQEIEVSAAADSHANAVTNLEIQLQQNASDLRKADLDVRFAKLDLERYVGKPFAAQLLEAYAAAVQDADVENGGGGLDAGNLKRLISSLLESDALEGEALQSIRKLTTDIQLAEEEHRRAAEKLKNSTKLEKKGYISREDFELDRLAVERRQIEEERARTAREQFTTYDFPKEVAQLISNVVEAEDRESRAHKRAKAAEAQKRSAVKSREKQWKLKRIRLESFVEQRKQCVLRATVPGLVVYASSRSGRWRGNDDRIQEGATVRQGQDLITIPDPKSLGVVIKVHETSIDKVRPGLDAWVEVDAAPGKRFEARVAEVNRMPDAADRWLNPDLKVYTTKLKLISDHATLKPGMSAQVEVHVKTLDDVIAVPTQAVAGTSEEPAVFVWKDGETVRRTVELGLASEHFVQVKSGVSVGDRLLLDPPREERSPDGDNGNGKSRRPGGQPGAGAAPSAGTKVGQRAGKPGGKPTGPRRQQPGRSDGEKRGRRDGRKRGGGNDGQ